MGNKCLVAECIDEQSENKWRETKDSRYARKTQSVEQRKVYRAARESMRSKREIRNEATLINLEQPCRLQHLAVAQMRKCEAVRVKIISGGLMERKHIDGSKMRDHTHALLIKL